MTSEMELLNKIRENFLSNRAKQEMAVATWAEKLKNVDPSILAGIALPAEISLQTLIPELYKPEPDAEVYKVQYKAAMELFAAVNRVADEYNKEALRLLAEYQQLGAAQ